MPVGGEPSSDGLVRPLAGGTSGKPCWLFLARAAKQSTQTHAACPLLPPSLRDLLGHTGICTHGLRSAAMSVERSPAGRSSHS